MTKSYRYYQHHSQAPDYDFGDDVLYSKPEAEKRPRSRDNDIRVLLWMCLIAFMVLSSFAAVKLIPGAEFRLDALFKTWSGNGHPNYQLGKVKLGTTMNILEDRHPGAQKAVAANGSIALSFNEADARYLVWYALDGPYHIAYKARQNRDVTGVSEADYVAKFVQEYGAPSVSTCSKRIMDAVRDCHYSWWLPAELRVDLITRVGTSATATDKLHVTLTATDTHMENRIQRAHLNTTTATN